jgi:peptide/nickel transport system ATP-binding protein
VLLDIRDLTVASTRMLVDGVSMQVSDGESVGIVGESGSGKSLTTRAIFGLLPSGVRQTHGSVLVRDRDVSTMTNAQLREVRGPTVGYIPQDPLAALNPLLPVGEQITEVLRVHRSGRSRLLADTAEILAGIGIRRPRTRREIMQRAVQMLDEVGISNPAERARQYPGSFSGGMRQRAVIAAAIALRPPLVVADEPTTALDATVERAVLDLIGDLRQQLGMALLIVSHDLDVVRWSCDRAYVMYQGRVMESAPVSDLFAAPRHPYTAMLLASSRLTVTNDAEPVATITREQRTGPMIGCPFVSRCPRALDRCRTIRPEASSDAPQHDYWCHNPIPTGLATKYDTS